MDSVRLRGKTRVFTGIAVLSNVLGNVSLSWGMRRVGNLLSFSPAVFYETFFNPWVALGILLLILWLLSHMALLSWADLSYVLPVTSVGYVLIALVGRAVLHETISAPHWGGILLISLGASLVGGTAPCTKKVTR